MSVIWQIKFGILLFKPILSEDQALYKNFEPKAVDPCKLLNA